eukprot:139602_1
MNECKDENIDMFNDRTLENISSVTKNKITKNKNSIKNNEQQLSHSKQQDEDTLTDIKIGLLSNVMKNKKTNISKLMSIPNCNKFVTRKPDKTINFKTLSNIFRNNDVFTTENDLTQTFDPYHYDESQLLYDLSQILVDHQEQNIFITEILMKDLAISDKQQIRSICGAILHEYTMTHNQNFNAVLIKLATKLMPNVDEDQVRKIAQNANLNSKIFIKGTNDFKNSLQFAKIFKSINMWEKKKWTKIYITMNKWKTTKTIQSSVGASETQVQVFVAKNAPIEENENESKYNQQRTDHINKGTDQYLLQQFCETTSATKHIAIQYLQQAEWNILIAMNNYYYTNAPNREPLQDDDIDVTGNVYNHGIAFWYWEKLKSEKRYVQKAYVNLKEEVLQFKQFMRKNWIDLIDECKILIKCDVIKNISSSGNKADIYGITEGTSITMGHLCAIKLYTDYSWLCKIFCECFRKKKLSETQYERTKSVQLRNEKVANWARLLIETVQSYGTFSTGKTKYYRGITMEFMFKRFVTRFNVPLSTTTNFNNATEFSSGDGLVIELKRYNEYIPGFDCSIASIFDDERETLFFGTESIFLISSIYQWYNKAWSSYRGYINQIRHLMSIAHGSIKWHNKNNMKKIISHILPDLYCNKISLPPYITSLLDYRLKQLPTEIGGTIEYDCEELAGSYQWVKNIFLVGINTPNVSNACNLFEYCNHMIFVMSD